MAKKPSREPHLRIRIESKLLGKLEKSREKNGHTLTGEIVARLEQSFQTDDRIAIYIETAEKRIEDCKRHYDESLAARSKELETAAASTEKFVEDMKRQCDELERTVRKDDEAKRAAAVVDVLLGGNAAKSHFLRSLAVGLAELPDDWFANESNRRQLIERVVGSLKN
jgi:hypothetical protein